MPDLALRERVAAATHPLPVLDPTEAERRRDQAAFWTIAIAALFFYSLIFPYRSIHLPPPIMVMLGFVLAGISAKFAFDHYHLLLLVFAAYAPFQKLLPGDFGYFFRAVNLTNVFLLFLVVGWVVRPAIRSESAWRRSALDVPLITFAFLSSISLLRGELDATSGQTLGFLWELKRWLTPIFIYFVFVNNVRDRKDLHHVYTCVLLLVALLAFRGVKEWYFDRGGLFGAVYGDIDRARVGGNAENPNQYGAFLCYYAFHLLSIFLLSPRRGLGWLGLSGFLLSARAMLLTFSRGASLAFALGAYVTALLWSPILFIFLVVPLTTFLAYNPAYIPGVLIGRWGDTFVAVHPLELPRADDIQVAGHKLDRSSMGRIALWQQGVRIVMDAPVIGIGFGRFRRVMLQYTGATYDSHNTYITIAAEMGIPALFVFLWLLVGLGKEAWRLYRRTARDDDPILHALAHGTLAGLAALLVSNTFGFRLNSEEIVFYFWILAALLVRANQILDDEVAASGRIAP